MASSTPSPVSFVDTSGARLAIYEEGATGDPIVLLHGGPGVPDYLGEVSAILAKGHRVIRFDQRGTGRSICHSGRYSLQDYVEDLDTVRRAHGLERLALFGHSWGGLLAQLYAMHHPDRVARLCLCNSGIGLAQLPHFLGCDPVFSTRYRSFQSLSGGVGIAPVFYGGDDPRRNG